MADRPCGPRNYACDSRRQVRCATACWHFLLAISAVLGVAGTLLLSTGGESTTATAQQQPPRLILYSGEDFTGRSIEVADTLLDMPVQIDPDGTRFDWNDSVHSIVVVSGTFRVWRHGRCSRF